MKQGKKYISPGAWFSMVYPADWNEFEDGEGSFLFYNPNEWTGNFRISAYKGDTAYGRESVKQELKENTSATLVKIGRLDCAYSKEMFEEEGTYYTSHLWIAGIDDVAFECSFTVRKGEPVAEAESIIASLEVRRAGQKYPGRDNSGAPIGNLPDKRSIRVGMYHCKRAVEERLPGTGRRYSQYAAGHRQRQHRRQEKRGMVVAGYYALCDFG